MLDPKTEHALSEVAKELSAICGERLVAVALYGSAAGSDFVRGVSDVNVVAVLDQIEHRHLELIRTHVRRWRKQGLATPLVVDRAFLRTAVDVFPMELCDIRDQHRLLFGQDVFTGLTTSEQHLRDQCEREARGKLLRLRELYLEVGNKPAQIQALMLDSLKTFLIIMRALNRLRGIHERAAYEAVLETFSREFECPLPVMSRLLRIKLAKDKWAGDSEAIFRDYVEELRRFVRVVDQIALS